MLRHVIGFYDNGSHPTPELYSARTPIRAANLTLTANQTRQVAAAGSNSVPTTATAIVLNLTVTSPTAASAITVFPTGTTRSTTPSLTFAAGQPRSVQVTTTIGANAQVSIHNAAGSAPVAVDVIGWFDGDPAPPGSNP